MHVWLQTVSVLTLFALSAVSAVADPMEALSKTAMSITGDIELDDSGITFANGVTLAFSDLIADTFLVDGEDKPASVYRVAEPADPELENGNTLCGTGDVTYVANWLDADGSTDWVAVFTGEDPPASAADMCASYTYLPKE